MPLGALGEHPGCGWPKNSPPSTSPDARHDRHREIAAHRQMALGHAMIGRALAVARIARISSERTGPRPAEGRLEDRGVARHREISRTPRAARRKACRAYRLRRLLDDVVKEGAELRAAQLDAGVGDHLDKPLEIKFGRDGDAGAIEHLERARFFRTRATRASSVSFSASNRASSALRSVMS